MCGVSGQQWLAYLSVESVEISMASLCGIENNQRPAGEMKNSANNGNISGGENRRGI
jgi:hypothetical protein